MAHILSKKFADLALSKECEVQHNLMSVLTIWGFFDTLNGRGDLPLPFLYPAASSMVSIKMP